MQLREAISAAGMTPPRELSPGRWLRFPGIGKGRSNRSGWCRVISPTLALFGDWSSNLSTVWRDEAHQDTEAARAALEHARRREREFEEAQRRRQREVAREATAMIERCVLAQHEYLARKGFPDEYGLVTYDHDGAKLVVPMRDSRWYSNVINVQLIAEDGTKRFLTGGRAGGAVLILGPRKGRHTVLCEGYATGLTLQKALALLPGPSRVVVCFSAMNLERVAPLYEGAVVAADNDRSATGERAAQATGLRWTMPYEVGNDWNDVHQAMGLHVVVERLRELWT